jgi:ubiquinone/menaquinone biosynthesis C-methylase UbiE
VHDHASSRYDFATVDRGDTEDHVAMMDATDAWPAVQAARSWVFDQVRVDRDTVVVDAGCGPGTFGAVAAARGAAVVVDVDRSLAMLGELRRRQPAARPVQADVARLPLRDGAAHLVRAERVLQWSADPDAALAELQRVTAQDGWIAVTDTDWGTFTVQHPDADATARLAAAALRWVPHPRLAHDLPDMLGALGVSEPQVRTDTVVITAWDPDDPAQGAGPPGLPLRSIIATAAPEDRSAVAEDLEVLADLARGGAFHATLVLVTVVARG